MTGFGGIGSLNLKNSNHLEKMGIDLNQEAYY